MTDQLSMFPQKTSEDLNNVTSSAEFSGGLTRLSSPAGADLFGQPLAPAPRSASPARKRSAQLAKATCLCGILERLATRYARIADTHGLPMPATFGRKFGGLQPSAALNEFLANRLRATMPLNGSPEYELRWKSSHTLLGLPICRLQASGRRISDSGYGGWPTPDTPSGGRGIAHAKRAGGTFYDKAGKKVQLSLENTAKMAGWMTPNTPRRNDSDHTAGKPYATKRQVSLEHQAAGWATPRASDGEKMTGQSIIRREAGRKPDSLPGQTRNGSSATSTEKPGALHPAFPCWLMGYPAAWDACAPTATRSSRKSPRSS